MAHARHPRIITKFEQPWTPMSHDNGDIAITPRQYRFAIDTIPGWCGPPCGRQRRLPQPALARLHGFQPEAGHRLRMAGRRVPGRPAPVVDHWHSIWNPGQPGEFESALRRHDGRGIAGSCSGVAAVHERGIVGQMVRTDDGHRGPQAAEEELQRQTAHLDEWFA